MIGEGGGSVFGSEEQCERKRKGSREPKHHPWLSIWVPDNLRVSEVWWASDQTGKAKKGKDSDRSKDLNKEKPQPNATVVKPLLGIPCSPHTRT